MKLFSILLLFCSFTTTIFVSFPLTFQKFFTNAPIQKVLDESVKLNGLVGVSGLKGNRDEINITSSGIRAVGFVQKVSDRDRWHLGSNGKALTSYMIALAATDNKLSFEQKVTDLLHGFPIDDSISVKDVMTHNSGVHDSRDIFLNQEFTKRLSKIETLAGIRFEIAKEIASKSRGDKKFQYANTNYLILAAILEKVYGKTWEILIREMVFVPLQMNECGLGPSGQEDQEFPVQPWGHKYSEGPLIAVPPTSLADNPEFMNPAGRIHCSLSSYSKFLKEWLRVAHGNSQLLNHNSQSMLLADNPEKNYIAGGWIKVVRKDGSVYFGHSGSNTFNFMTTFLFPDKNMYYSVATNTYTPKTPEVVDAVLAAMIKN